MSARDGSAWESRATFLSTGDGMVDVATTPALEGTYAGVSAMGLLWSMRRVPGGGQAAAGPARLRDPVTITVSAESDDGRSASAQATRLAVAPGVTYRPLDSNGRLKGGWWLPAGSGPHPGLIVLGGSGGGADHGRAALYASHGFAALALAYFGVPGLPRGLVNIPLEYVGEAIDLAAVTLRPRSDFIGVEGISRGGELALLVSATFPAVRAVVALMASGLVMGPFGEPEPGDARPAAAWTLGGQAVPDLFTGNPKVDWSTVEAGKPIDSLVPGYLAAMRDAASSVGRRSQSSASAAPSSWSPARTTGWRRGSSWPRSLAIASRHIVTGGAWST
jgi:hypothetical protein